MMENECECCGKSSKHYYLGICTTCIKSMPALKAENAKLKELLLRYRNETPLGHQPHMIAHEVDAAIQPPVNTFGENPFTQRIAQLEAKVERLEEALRVIETGNCDYPEQVARKARLKAALEGNDVGVEEQFQAGLRDVERNLREDK